MFDQRRRNLASSLVCIGFGMMFCIGSVRYGDVRSGIPSAGFFPFMGGAILICLSLVELISVIVDRKKKEDPSKREQFFPQRNSWKRLLLILLSLFAYVFSLEYLGFSISTFLFVIFLMRFLEPQKWITAIAMAFLTSILSYALFELWLKVQLPKGLFGV